MTVFRLEFENEDPLDVKPEDVVEFSTEGAFSGSIAVRLRRGPLGGNITYQVLSARPVEREEDSNVDLH